MGLFLSKYLETYNLNQTFIERIMHKIKFSILGFFLFFFSFASAQKITIDGYVFEEHNRGFLNEVDITVLDQNATFIGKTMSDSSGHFTFDVDAGKKYSLQFEKKVFKPVMQEISTAGKKAGDKIFIEKALPRLPGYLLELSLAEKRYSEDIPVDAINGARVEIYNNTKHKEELVIDSIKSPNIGFTLQQGNHYTILIRKKGFFSKRLEAHVNVDGCYLCMEGFGTVTPGVMDNLTSSEDNKVGSLISNLEMDRIDTNRNIVIDNIYYDYNSFNITTASQKELNKIVNVLKLNPSLIMELGSHTDTRGSEEFNQRLSQERAQAAVNYVVNHSNGFIDYTRLKAKGYGKNHLINKCSDGVPCSEEEHSKNRRTELRIIGFTKDIYDSKSLLEIIHAEEMSKFLSSDESDKEYKIQTIPSKNADSAVHVIPKSVTPTKNGAIKTSERNFPTAPAQQNRAEVIRNTQAPSDFKSSNAVIVVDVTPIGNYTGYKIELMKSPTELSKADLNNIAENFSSNINTDRLPNGQISYLIGNISGWSEAERFLEKVSGKFPNAKIVDYYNGKRIE